MSIVTPEAQSANSEMIRERAIPLLDIYGKLYTLNLDKPFPPKAGDICFALGISRIPNTRDELIGELDKFVDKFNPAELFNKELNHQEARAYWGQFNYIIKNGFAVLEKKLFGQMKDVGENELTNDGGLKSLTHRADKYTAFYLD